MSREEYSNKLNHYYDAEGKLTQYPSKRSMRILALEKIACSLQKGKYYTEKEVNEKIRENIAFSDIETIRREMFQFQFIGRLRDGSQYWLEEDWKKVYEKYES